MFKLFAVCFWAFFAVAIAAPKPAWFAAPLSYTAGVNAVPGAYTAGYVAPYASTYNAYSVAHTAAFPAAYAAAPVVAASPAFYHAAPVVAPAARVVAAPAVHLLKKK